MTTRLNLRYSVTFGATTEVIDINQRLSSEDVAQQQVQVSEPDLVNHAAKRLEVVCYPTPFATPNAARIYDINLESLQVEYAQIIYLKSEAQFLYSTADSLPNLATAARTLARLAVVDRGTMVSPTAFTPDIPYPKYIRIMNPLEVNGGGTGNDSDDTPITVSVFILTTPPTD